MGESIINRTKSAALILFGKQPPRNRIEPIPGITSKDVEEVRAFFTMRKFFILGHARSGTTMLARLIRLHPDVVYMTGNKKFWGGNEELHTEPRFRKTSET